MQTENLEGQESIFDRDSGSGKMSSVLSQVGGTLKRVKKSLGRIFKKSSKRSSKLKNHTFMLLDLRPGAGNMLGAYWEYDPPWLGSFWDAQHFGVPQRRRRVFLVADFAGYSAIPILAIPDSVPGYSAARRVPRQIAAALIGSSFAYAGRT